MGNNGWQAYEETNDLKPRGIDYPEEFAKFERSRKRRNKQKTHLPLMTETAPHIMYINNIDKKSDFLRPMLH